MAGEELCQDCGARLGSNQIKTHISVNHDRGGKKCAACQKVTLRSPAPSPGFPASSPGLSHAKRLKKLHLDNVKYY